MLTTFLHLSLVLTRYQNKIVILETAKSCVFVKTPNVCTFAEKFFQDVIIFNKFSL